MIDLDGGEGHAHAWIAAIAVTVAALAGCDKKPTGLTGAEADKAVEQATAWRAVAARMEAVMAATPPGGLPACSKGPSTRLLSWTTLRSHLQGTTADDVNAWAEVGGAASDSFRFLDDLRSYEKYKASSDAEMKGIAGDDLARAQGPMQALVGVERFAVYRAERWEEPDTSATPIKRGWIEGRVAAFDAKGNALCASPLRVTASPTLDLKALDPLNKQLGAGARKGMMSSVVGMRFYEAAEATVGATKDPK